MKFPRAVPLVIVFLILVTGLSAQSFLTRTFEENDGLINSSINDIAQDAAGRMWFASRGGISVYDGAFWSSYTTANGLAALAVTKIRADGLGSIWAVGSNPNLVLMRFDGKTWTSFPFPPIKGPPVLCVALAVRLEAGGVRVAVGTNLAGMLVFDGFRWKALSKTEGLAGNAIRDLVVLENGFLAATDEGLSWVGENSVQNRWENDDPLLRGDIRGVTVENTPGGEKILILGSDWLGSVQGGRFEIALRNSPLSFNRNYPTAVLLPDRKGGLLFANMISIYFYDRNSRSAHPLGSTQGLIADGATSLFLDRENNIWIGGVRGVSRISSRRFFNYRKAQGLLEDEVTAIHAFGAGAIAFGHNSGLTILAGGELRHVIFDRNPNIRPKDIRILDMAPDNEGRLWFAASARGLGRLDGDDSLHWINFPVGPGESVTSVAFDSYRRLWISRNNALFQLQNGRPVDVFPGLFLNSYLRKIIAAPDGSIYVATASRGVYRWDGKEWARFVADSDPGAANVFSVFIDSAGRTMVGTFSGLYQIAGTRLDRFSKNGFEIRRPVYLIQEDKSGRLWFGTDNGLIRWDGKTRRDYSKAEGLAGREINRSAGMIDQAGRFWIGTNNGVSCYHEFYDTGSDEIPPPILSITGLEINGKSVDFSEEIDLGYRENNLVFHFVGTSFIDENALRFESRLDGFDKTWSSAYATSDRQIRYTNLAPGKYIFNLKAKNALGRWSDPISSPTIRIRNPFWLQWWFILSGVLLVGGLIVSLGLAVTEYRQAERLEALVKDRTAQIQTSLNEKEILLKEIHHRVKNNLQIISSLLFLQSRRIKDPGMLVLFQGSISRIRAMALVHESLYRSDQLTSILMEDYLRELAHHLMETYSLRKEPVIANVQASGISLPLETAITYGLIVNELVSNAFKHAFPDDRKGLIQITLARADGDKETKGIVLTVSDNGIGIPEEMEGGKADSLGLRLVQNLVSQMDGTIEILRDGGTIFRIIFPA